MERRQKAADVELDRLTLAVNTGTIITYDRKALSRWQSRRRGPQTPAAFRSTVSRLAGMFPDKIKH